MQQAPKPSHQPKDIRDDSESWSDEEVERKQEKKPAPEASDSENEQSTGGRKWEGFKKTIRKVIKYSPNQRLNQKKLFKTLRGPYKNHLKGSGAPYDFAAFKAKVIEKVAGSYRDKESEIYQRREGRLRLLSRVTAIGIVISCLGAISQVLITLTLFVEIN